ncbi:SOS response-associated peptidase [Pseudoflavitalea sp. G-6-1-2]|uniref:SOS response-associated peptidase n=1 Tax=Pseudoflavitalea sp. G-6-1-2 TaxID=2728841 RepID=UPI00146F1AFA|nr:SOS response-associated peptidase [Pseudoflavitalea sp. G-6-1-2]NML20879.1 SOS response-associated peptidase [Pseudoflavitalea sp. G-6-1-2]
MCYYNGVKVTHSEFIRLKQLEKAIAQLDFLNRPLLIGFDYSDAPVIKAVAGKVDFEVTQMEWGFIPPYLKNREAVDKFRNGYKDANGKFHPPITTLNAVGEEMLLPGKMYRDAALHRRCLVLSSGFYEWRHVHPMGKQGKPLKTAVKYPYHISVTGKEVFFMAGIWQPWTDKETGEVIETFAIVTTAANKLMQQIHNSKMRMPVILSEDLAWDWLFKDLSEEEITRIATSQFPTEQMSAHTIAKDFRAMPEPAAPFEYAELTPVEN